MKKNGMKKIIAVFLAVAITVFFACPLFPSNQANAARDYSTVRVLLTQLGTPGSIAVQVNGVYSIAGRSDIKISSGSTITVRNSGGQLQVTTGAGTFNPVSYTHLLSRT